MIRTLLLILLLPGVASAVICKTVGPDGSVTYEDLPADRCEQPVDLPEFSTYTPRQPGPAVLGTPAGQPGTVDGSVFDAYQALRIVQPPDGGTVRDNNGQVTVSLEAEPGLQPGHHVRLTLDGVQVKGEFDGLSIVLSNVRRGTHGLTAAIHDAAGARLIVSEPASFTMRQASALNRPSVPGDAAQPDRAAPDQSPPSIVPSPALPLPGSRPNPVPSGPAPAGNSPAYRPAYGG
jgi:hypothetical protein